MSDWPVAVWVLGAAGLMALAIPGARGLLEIREALRSAEFERLASPPQWLAVRALAATVGGVVTLLALAPTGVLAWVAAAGAGTLACAAAPRGLLAARQRAERALLDELPLHLDLLALALESGCGWSAALALCIERTADGPLRRCWQRAQLEIHAGLEPLEALRHLEQRTRLRPFTTLVSALRAAEKLQMPAAAVLRDRARQAAAAQFARAERQARAAPLKLWAAMVLCLAPCTALVLAWPVAQMLAAVLA